MKRFGPISRAEAHEPPGAGKRTDTIQSARLLCAIRFKGRVRINGRSECSLEAVDRKGLGGSPGS